MIHDDPEQVSTVFNARQPCAWRAFPRSREDRLNAKVRRARTTAAWVLLVGSIIAWPVSHFTFAHDEAPVTLALSWMAIVIVALDLLTTSQVAERADDKD